MSNRPYTSSRDDLSPAGKIIGFLISCPIIAGLLYWYAHLWHRWSAEKFTFWACLVLAPVFMLAAYNSKLLQKIMGLIFSVSLITQVLVWLGIVKAAPIF